MFVHRHNISDVEVPIAKFGVNNVENGSQHFRMLDIGFNYCIQAL